MKAWLDEQGCSVKGNFLVVRPSVELPAAGITLWALLNSPLANAYVYSRATKRHIIGSDLLELPLPTIEHDHGALISAAAYAYREAVRELDRALVGEESRAKVRTALLAMDAAVLRAYDLPPRLERQLLDLFTGWERKGVGLDDAKGRSTFRGYYPPGFTSALPLHMVISERFEQAAADKTAERFRAGESAYVREVLDAASVGTGEV